jgi:hypothetical protein
MDNRLLSEQGIIDILGWPTLPDYELHRATAAAQLAKADKEWVEWVITNAEVEGDTIILPGKLWREHRKEIGL